MILRGAVFDLDDTLYLERDYVLSAFDSVAQHVALTTKLDKATIVSEFLAIHDSGGRGRVFDAWLANRPSLKGQLHVASLVESYRTHAPRISLLPGVSSLIDALRRGGLKLGIVTDGHMKCQRAKVVALGLEKLFDRIVLTDEWGPTFWKPNTRAFELFEDEWSYSPNELVYVADNPRKDFIGPKSRGWLTVRLRLMGQLWRDTVASKANGSAALEVDSVESLLGLLLEKASPPGGADTH